MALNPDIRDQAYQFFIEEAPELLQSLEAGLLTLSQERNTAKVHQLMRAAHTIKGGASSVGLDVIATIAHRLENIFKALYSEALEIDTNLENQLLQAFDCLRLPLTEQIANGYFDADRALAAAEPVFVQIEERCGDALTQAESYVPSSAEMGVDMVSSIFEIDVAEGLERLAAVIIQPDQYEVAGEVRTLAEVFAGFAEFLNLPQFGAIAIATQQAIDRHPDRASEIAQLALADFTGSRQEILAGHHNGTGASAALLDFGETAPIAADEWVNHSAIDEIPIEHTAMDHIAIEPMAIEPMAVDEISIDEIPTDEIPTDEILTDEILADEIPIDEIPIDPRINNGLASDEDVAVSNLEGLLASLQELADVERSLLADIDDTTDLDIAESADEELADIALPLLEDIFGSSDYTSVIHPESIGDLNQELEENSDRLNRSAFDDLTHILEADLPDLVTEPIADLHNVQDSHPEDTSSQSQTLRAPAQTPEPAVAPLTVRVDSSRLEQMNNMVGELAINRDGLSLQNEQLQIAMRELRNRFTRFQAIVTRVQELSDQMLIASEQYGYRMVDSTREGRRLVSATDSPAVLGLAPVEFDSLEMDRYSTLHSQLQEIVEEIVQLEEAVDDTTLYASQSHQMLDQQRHILTQLRDELVWARMLPFSEVVNRFPRVLRDLSAAYRKPTHLKLTGTGVLIDRAILEKLYDPLLHLLRNAFDHGIETPEIRQQRGKSPEGQIEIRAYHKGNQTIIEIKDDGQGLNFERIRGRVLELGWLTPEQLMVTPTAHLSELIFEPGFSTAYQVSQLSGRGVGLDVVRSQLRAAKGTVSVASAPGKGTTFTLQLPLTLTIAKLIVCLVSSTALAFPTDSVEEILTPQSGQTQQSGTQRFLRWRNQFIPIYRLAELLDYTCPIPDTSSKTLAAIAPPKEWALPVLVLRHDNQAFALEVDQLVTEQELVIKPFGSAIAPPSYIYGCTIFRDGSLIPVIDGTELLSLGVNQATAAAPPIAALQITQAATILVVDDAVTLRRTLALSLERVGFRVLQARDGQEAIEQLQHNSVKLVICDIEMPNMNGFEFLSHRRQQSHLAAVPVVMLTSRSNEKHRWLAMQLGATAYFTKPYVEQEFLAALQTIIDTDQTSES